MVDVYVKKFLQLGQQIIELQLVSRIFVQIFGGFLFENPVCCVMIFLRNFYRSSFIDLLSAKFISSIHINVKWLIYFL